MKVSLRIPLPKGHPDKFIQIMRDVVAKHEQLGVASPLNDPTFVDMADFKQKLEQAGQLREASIAARADAEAFMGQAKKILGTTEGQSINTEGTLYYMLDSIKKLLVVKYRGVEQELETFGFHVVVGSTKKVGRKKKVS